jgi:integrase
VAHEDGRGSTVETRAAYEGPNPRTPLQREVFVEPQAAPKKIQKVANASNVVSLRQGPKPGRIVRQPGAWAIVEAKVEAEGERVAREAAEERALDAEDRALCAEAVAERRVEAEIAGIRKLFATASPAPAGDAPSIESPTLSAFAKRWTSGDLHREYPDHVRDIGQDDNRERLALVCAAPLADGPYATVGDVPLSVFTEAHALAAMGALPKRLASATRAHVAHALSHLLKLARFPAGLIKAHPLSPGFVPLRGPRKAGAWWRPDDDAALLAHVGVPLVSRLFYGFTLREGLREDEAAPLTWRDVRVEKKGARIILDENKTDDPRSWALYPGTYEALTAWRELLRAVGLPVQDDAPIFVHHKGRYKGTRLYVKHLAETFRAHVVRAELWRSEFDKAPNRMRLRFHDVRAGFVSWALATGRSEAWVTDRTGHTSSAMLYRYKRRARAQEELEIGEPLSLLVVIPELQPQGGSGAGPGETAPPTPDQNDVSSAGGVFRFRRREACGFNSRPVHSDAADTPDPGVPLRSLKADASSDPPGAPEANAEPPSSDVDAALVFALREATSAGAWDAVTELARALSSRRVQS